MKILITQVAATKDRNLLALEEEYEKRLSPFLHVENLTVPASKSDDPKKSKDEEAKALLKKLDSDAFIIALDPAGKQITSEGFAELIREQRDFGPGRIQFLIGGSHGLHDDLLEKSHKRLSFSKMTFTHEMVRVFLKEQLYRAATILAGKTYHK
jgi:23S rRNA (pseudouridine1915-N3)-methyltransferase